MNDTAETSDSKNNPDPEPRPSLSMKSEAINDIDPGEITLFNVKKPRDIRDGLYNGLGNAVKVNYANFILNNI